MDPVITVVGNLVGEPERRATKEGVAVTAVRVAATPRRYDRASGEWKNGESLFLNVSCWRTLADNVALSLHKGDPVIVTGRLVSRRWTDQNDDPHTSLEVDALTIGPDLARGSCEFTRSRRSADDSDLATVAGGTAD